MTPQPELQESFIDFVNKQQFPCICGGNRAELAFNHVEVLGFGDLTSRHNNFSLITSLYSFVEKVDFDNMKSAAFVAVFEQSQHLDDSDFNKSVWRKLQELQNLVSQSTPRGPHSQSSDCSNNFHFNLDGEPLYITCLSPTSASRNRKFKYPAIVFNLMPQFEVPQSFRVIGSHVETHRI